MHRLITLLMFAMLVGCGERGDATKSVSFELICRPLPDVAQSLKGDASFSTERIRFRYGSAEKSFHVRLGEDYVLNEQNPIAIIRGKPIKEPVYRFGVTRGNERYSFAVERETMGVTQYIFYPSTELLTEIYVNFEPRDASDRSKGGTEAVIVKQAKCQVETGNR